MSTLTELPHIDFDLSGNPYCCGIYDLGSFSYRQNNQYGGYNKEYGKLHPKEKVFSHLDTRIAEELWDEVRHNGGEDDGYYVIQTTLITTTPEFEELAKHFKDKKWKLTAEFVNHNTKNTVFAFSKKFKYSALERKYGSKDDDNDW